MLKDALIQLNKQLGGRHKDTFVSYHALEWILGELMEPMKSYDRVQAEANRPIIYDLSTEKAFNAGVIAGQKEIKDILEAAWRRAYVAGNAMDGFFIFQGAFKQILFDEVHKDG